MKLLITFLLCLSALTFTQAKITADKLRDYRETLSLKLTSGSLHDLPDIYYRLHSLVESGDKAEHTSTTKETACNFLKKVGFEKAVDAGLGSEFISVYTTFGCPRDELRTEFSSVLKSAEKGDKLSDIHHALQLAKAHKTYNGSEVVEACNKVIDLIRDDGMARSNKRSGEYSFSNTVKVFDILQICKSLNVLDNRSLKRLEPIIESVLKNAKTSKGGLLFPEGDFFLTTSNLVSSILGFNPEAIGNEDLSRIATFLRSHEHNIDTPQKTHSFNRVGTSLKSVPTVRLVNSHVSRTKDTTLQVRLANILGDEITKPKLWKVKGSIYPVGERSSAVVSNINFDKKADENLYEGKVAANSIKKSGIYELKLSVATGTSTYEYVEELVVKDTLTVKSVAFEITKSSDLPHEGLQNKVRSSETFPNRLPANQDNYIHIAVQLDSTSTPVGLVAARLANNAHRFSTGTVVGTKDSQSDVYRIVIDLGDPEHVLPYNGQYDLEIIVSGEAIAEPLRWTLANLDITFGKPADNNKPPVSDADLQILPEIHHQFPTERRKPSVLLTGLFNVAIVVCVLGFLLVLSRIGVNLNKLPESFVGKIFTLVFLGLIVALFGTLALFWLKINIFETLLVLVLLAGPTLLIGDRALRSIANNRTN